MPTFVTGLMEDLFSLVLLDIERRRYGPLLDLYLTSTNELVAAELTDPVARLGPFGLAAPM